MNDVSKETREATVMLVDAVLDDVEYEAVREASLAMRESLDGCHSSTVDVLVATLIQAQELIHTMLDQREVSPDIDVPYLTNALAGTSVFLYNALMGAQDARKPKEVDLNVN